MLGVGNALRDLLAGYRLLLQGTVDLIYCLAHAVGAFGDVRGGLKLFVHGSAHAA